MSKDDKEPKGTRILPLSACEHQVVGLELGEPNENGVGTATPIRLTPAVPDTVVEGDLVQLEREEGTPFLRKKVIAEGSRKVFGFSRKYAESYDRIDWSKGKKTDPSTLN